MPDYSKGKIYKIICDATDEIYVGSTTQPLYKRLSTHKRHQHIRNLTSKILFEKGNCEIILIEDYPCERKEQLHARERHYIENLGNVINKTIPTRTDKEYYVDNKEKIKEKDKQYYENNKEHIIERSRKYKRDNKEKIKEHYDKYQSLRICCLNCGSEINTKSLNKHQRTIKCSEATDVA